MVSNSIFDHVLIALSKTTLLEIRFPITNFISINTFFQTYKNFLIIRVTLDESEKNAIIKEIKISAGKNYNLLAGIKLGVRLTLKNFSFWSNKNANQSHNLNPESLDISKVMICSIRIFRIFYQNSHIFKETVDNVFKNLDLAKIECPSFDDFIVIAY